MTRTGGSAGDGHAVGPNVPESGGLLEPFADELWVVERPQRFYGVETGTRMTVARLEGGGLFVHCPVALTPELRAAVDALGEVRAVVASSLFHHLYVGDWLAAYPDATVHASPGLERKRADVPWSGVLGDEPEPAWEGQLDQVFFSARFEREVVFFHRRSRTLVTADALLNLSRHPSRVTRCVAHLMGNTAPGQGWVERRFAVRDRRAARREVDRMLAWDFERIALAHGDPVRTDGHAILEAAYAWT